ncbi:MAG: hypothetical protein JW702_08200, partial [Clostridiales bacterium]|nr:hypothetical protein [Clostridiales bacterium]
MKKQEKKSRIPVIMLALLLIISSIAVTLPSVHAQTTEKVTHAFIGAIPNPVGVNQQVLLHVGITDYLA